MHLAETKKQALEDVRYGYEQFCEYTQDTLALPTFRAVGKTFEERIAWINETGLGVIGTPDDAIKQIQRLVEQSNGGFGCYMMMQHDWANWDATQRSLRALRAARDAVLPAGPAPSPQCRAVRA